VTAPSDVRFYFDLSSVESYLMAERMLDALPVVAEWQPVARERLPGPSTEAFRCASEQEIYVAELQRRAANANIQPLRWPPAWPELDSTEAMLAATYAKSIGRAVAFAQAAFRQIFAGGRDPADRDTLVIAGAACEMHPRALVQAITLSATARTLVSATQRAIAVGVHEVPAVSVGAAVFRGSGELADAAGAIEHELAASAATPPRK